MQISFLPPDFEWFRSLLYRFAIFVTCKICQALTKKLYYKSFSQIDNINTRYHLLQNFQTIFYKESFLRIFFSLKQVSLSGLFQLRSQFFAQPNVINLLPIDLDKCHPRFFYFFLRKEICFPTSAFQEPNEISINCKILFVLTKKLAISLSVKLLQENLLHALRTILLF